MYIFLDGHNFFVFCFLCFLSLFEVSLEVFSKNNGGFLFLDKLDLK